MYDDDTINRALKLLARGLTPRQVSRLMGGKPGHAIIRHWGMGYLPEGKRSTSCSLSADQKIDALMRMEAGENYRDVAASIGCAPCSLLTWRRMYQEGGREALTTRIDRYLAG